MQIDWTELTPSDLPGDLGEIADDCDMDFAKYLVEMWGGAMIYIPTLSKLRKSRRDQLILRDFDGSNAGRIASRYGVSRRYVSKLVRDVERPAEADDGEE